MKKKEIDFCTFFKEKLGILSNNVEIIEELTRIVD